LPMLRPQPLGFPRLLEHELGALGNGQFERDEFAGLGLRNSGFLLWSLLGILRWGANLRCVQELLPWRLRKESSLTQTSGRELPPHALR
jgi:hypothetical protein